MRSREVKKLLWDIEEACGLLLKFTQGRTLEQYLEDDLLRSAVERQAEIAGEALKRAADIDPSISEHISDFRAIIAFRNRLAHGYWDIAPETVWVIGTTDAARLLAQVRALMAEP